jgi:putative spermidine/putrescine transport system substrate-binding protein
MTETTRNKGLSRRTLLKSTAGLAGLAAGSGAITGFPYVMSAEPKVLRYLGTAVNEGDEISKQCLKDTGIKIEYITATTDDVTKRVMTQPNSFDVLDTEYFALKKIVPSGNILALDARKIKEFDNITPVFTKGQTPGGKKIGGQGTAPWKVLYLEGKDSKKFATSATEFVTLIPTVYNADTLGIRPDIIKRPISSWAELLNPEFKGKASILNIPSIGIMDAAMVVEATGKYKYADKGNMTKDEIDLTMKERLQRERQPDGLGRDRHPVDVVAGGDEGPLDGDCLHLPAAQGRLSLLGLGLLRFQGRLGCETRMGL